MKHLLELVTDVLGNDEQTQVFDSSACGTRTTSRQHGKQEQIVVPDNSVLVLVKAG
jgi:hypothetical protein